MLKAINIKWDTDENMEVLNKLPTKIIIPDDLEAMYKIDRNMDVVYITINKDGNGIILEVA